MTSGVSAELLTALLLCMCQFLSSQSERMTSMRVLLSLDDPPLTMEEPYVSLYNTTMRSLRRKKNGTLGFRDENGKVEAIGLNRKGLPFGKLAGEKDFRS